MSDEPFEASEIPEAVWETVWAWVEGGFSAAAQAMWGWGFSEWRQSIPNVLGIPGSGEYIGWYVTAGIEKDNDDLTRGPDEPEDGGSARRSYVPREEWTRGRSVPVDAQDDSFYGPRRGRTHGSAAGQLDDPDYDAPSGRRLERLDRDGASGGPDRGYSKQGRALLGQYVEYDDGQPRTRIGPPPPPQGLLDEVTIRGTKRRGAPRPTDPPSLLRQRGASRRWDPSNPAVPPVFPPELIEPPRPELFDFPAHLLDLPESIGHSGLRRKSDPTQGPQYPDNSSHGVDPARPVRYLGSMPAPERSFWNRGGTGLLIGGLIAVGSAVVIISTPVGWGIGLTLAMSGAGGVAAFLTSATQVGDSYLGGATVEQDEAASRVTNVVLGISSPGGLAGGVAGTVLQGNVEGLEEGAFYGGLAEGLVSLGVGVGRVGLREYRFGVGPANMKWGTPVRQANQRVFDLPPVYLRRRWNPLFPKQGNIEWIELSHALSKNPTKGPAAWMRNRIGDERYWKVVNRPWNLKPMWGTEHALIDPQRFRTMEGVFKETHSARRFEGLARFIRLAPDWTGEVALGASRIGMVSATKPVGARWDAGVLSDGWRSRNSDGQPEDEFDEFDETYEFDWRFGEPEPDEPEEPDQ